MQISWLFKIFVIFYLLYSTLFLARFPCRDGEGLGKEGGKQQNTPRNFGDFVSIHLHK
jgi:hypothetical protein